jgi:hypothetical protein
VATLSRRIAGLDDTLFDVVESQTTVNDRRSLLALHHAAARLTGGGFAYLEIGSHLGGSLQVLVRDRRCERIFSIDARPDTVPDERGYAFSYPANSTARMVAELSTVRGADLDKLRTIDASTATLDPQLFDARPSLCFVDAEHTDEAVRRDGHFCRNLLGEAGVLAFHDAYVVYRGLSAFLDDLSRSSVEHHVLFLPDTLLVVEFGDARLLRLPQIRKQIAANWQGYLWTLNHVDVYREIVRQQRDVDVRTLVRQHRS